MKTNMKRPGGEAGTVTAELDLSYHKRFPGAYVPEACLLRGRAFHLQFQCHAGRLPTFLCSFLPFMEDFTR
jgi:hypothetical protein